MFLIPSKLVWKTSPGLANRRRRRRVSSAFVDKLEEFKWLDVMIAVTGIT